MADPGIVSFTRTEAYSSFLAANITQMRRERLFTDFRITTNDESLPCHKLIIAAHSPVLKAMLSQTDAAETTQNSIGLDNIKSGVIQVILDYMYDEQISFRVEQLQDVITACDVLQMKMLKDACLNFAPSEWKADDLELGTDSDLAKLTPRCTEVKPLNFQDIAKQPNFLKISLTDLQGYLSNTKGSDVDQDLVLSTVLCWVNHDAGNRLVHLETLLGEIQLKDCSSHGILGAMEKFGAVIVANFKVYNLLMQTALDLSTAERKISVSEPETDRKLVVIGAQADRYEKMVCWEVDNTSLIRELCKVPEDVKIRYSVCVTPLGFVVTGGENSDICMMFVAASKTWLSLPNLLTPRCCHGSICLKGVLHVIGGVQSIAIGYLRSVETLALEGGNWQLGPELPVDMAFPLAIQITDTIFVLDASNDINRLVKLDTESTEWVNLASLPIQSQGVGLTAADGKLFVAGGDRGVCFWYDPATDSWYSGEQPQLIYIFGNLLYFQNKLFLLGGCGEFVEEYNIDDDSWSVCTWKLPAPLRFHQALALDVAK